MVWEMLKARLGDYHSVFFDTSAILSLAVLPEEAFRGQHKRLVAAQESILEHLGKKEAFITKAIADELSSTGKDGDDSVRLAWKALVKAKFSTFDFRTTEREHTALFIELLRTVVSYEDRFAQHLAALVLSRKQEIEESKDIEQTLKPLLAEAKRHTLFDLIRPKGLARPRPGELQHPYLDLSDESLQRVMERLDALIVEWEKHLDRKKGDEKTPLNLQEKMLGLRALLWKKNPRQYKKGYEQFLRAATDFSKVVAERDERDLPQEIKVGGRIAIVLRTVYTLYIQIAMSDHFIVNESLYHMLFVTNRPTLLVSFDRGTVTYAECLHHAMALAYFLKYPFYKKRCAESIVPGRLNEFEEHFPPPGVRKVAWSIFDAEGKLHTWEFPEDFSHVVTQDMPGEFGAASDYTLKDRKGYAVVERLT